MSTLKLGITWERYGALLLLQRLKQESYQSLIYQTLDNTDLLDFNETLKLVRSGPRAMSINLSKARNRRVKVLADELGFKKPNALARLTIAHLLVNYKKDARKKV